MIVNPKYNTMHNFKELKVWQQAMDLVKFLYSTSYQFPKEELFGLTSQVKRSAISIPSNIAEGAGYTSPKKIVQFLEVVNGSSYELNTQTILSHDLGFLSPEQNIEVEERLQEIQKMLYKLMSHYRAG